MAQIISEPNHTCFVQNITISGGSLVIRGYRYSVRGKVNVNRRKSASPDKINLDLFMVYRATESSDRKLLTDCSKIGDRLLENQIIDTSAGVKGKLSFSLILYILRIIVHRTHRRL